MGQKQINKNVDYLYNLQKDETSHQNHRIIWILSAQALLFTALCALNHDELHDTIKPLIIIMGLLLAISAIYSISISELSIGHVFEMWDEYDKSDNEKKGQPYPHRVSLSPNFIMNSRGKFLMFFKFAPNVLFSSWFVLVLVLLEQKLNWISIPVSRSIASIILFFMTLLLVCFITSIYHELLMGRLRKERVDEERQRKQQKEHKYCSFIYCYHCCHWCNGHCIVEENSISPKTPTDRGNSSNHFRNDQSCSSSGAYTQSSKLGCKQKEYFSQTQLIDLSNLSIYHIIIDRFCGEWTNCPIKGSDGFYGGNLKGIISKLDYILSLGHNAIMITPVFATKNYHGYHITNYECVDKHFGTWGDFQRLIKEAHNKGLIVICDFVPNHCHYENPIFQSALNEANSPYRNWFYFDKSRKGDYVSCQNYPELPKFNLYNKAASDYLISIAIRMAKMGIDGLRIDHAIGVPFSFLTHLCYSIKTINPNLFVFGEAWLQEPRDITQIEFADKSRKDDIMNGKYIQNELQLDYKGIFDGILDFSFRDIILDEIKKGNRLLGNKSLENKLKCHFTKYPSNYVPFLFVDNHDTNRFLFYCKNDKSLLQEALCLMRSYPYPMIIYYGTEDGMCNDYDINDKPNGDDDVRKPKMWV